MNIESYRLFLRAARLGSLTAAAEQSGYTQAAVSHIIAGLEQEFGFPLFTRSKAGVALTKDGERMLNHIREVVNRDDITHQVADEIKGLQSGRVRIGAFSSAAVCWLPDIIRDFKALYPNIELDLRVDTYKTIEDWIANEEVDCGFTSRTEGKELEYIPLAEDRMLALLPDGHPFAELPALPLECISKMDFIIPGEGSNYDVGRILRSAGIKPRVSFAVSDDYAAIAMVKKGLGMTIIPELILRGIGQTGNAMELVPKCTRTICLAAKAHTAVSPACRAFIAFVRRSLDKWDAGPENSADGAKKA